MSGATGQAPRRRRRRETAVSIKVDSSNFVNAEQFEHLQHNFLLNTMKLPGEPLWPQALLLFEGLTQLAEIEAIAATGQVYADGSAARLDWTRENGRRDSRHLSWISRIALQRDGGDPRAGGHLAQRLGDTIRLHWPGAPVLQQHSATDAGPSGACPAPVAEGHAALQWALDCARDWLFLKLDQYQVAHIHGDAPMTALPRSAFARAATGMALTATPAEDPDDGAAELIDRYFHATGDDSRTNVIARVLKGATLSGSAVLDDAALLGNMAATWRGLGAQAEAAGPITSLLLAHVVRLAAKGEHSPRSVVGYVKAGVPVVLAALAGSELEAMDGTALTAAYTSAFERLRLRGEKLKKAKAFVGHFHRFVRDWLDLPPLALAQMPEPEPTLVDANVVTPDEADQIEGWLTAEILDERLATQSSLVFRLLRRLGVRVSEVLFLQVRNVRRTGSVVEIEFSGRGRLHSLKTPQAVTVKRIDDPVLAAEVYAHKLRRTDEEALGADLLFGTKDAQRRVYRLSAMYRWLNNAAKAASGEPGACCHWFRHAVIDARQERIALGLAPGDSLEQLSVDSQHVGLDVTQRNYMHSFQSGLRLKLDLQLLKVKLSSSVAGWWIGISGDLVRQRYARQWPKGSPAAPLDATSARRPSCHEFNWQLVALHAASCTVEEAQAPFVWHEPVPPKPLGAGRAATPVDWLGFIVDLQKGRSLSEAALQRRLDHRAAIMAEARLLALGQQALLTKASTNGRQWGQITAPRAALMALGIAASRAYQPKYANWLLALANQPPPPMPKQVFTAWREAARGRYIRLNAPASVDPWLPYLLASGLSASKLVTCRADAALEGHPLALAEQTQDLMPVLRALGKLPTDALRGYRVKPRKGRPDLYLLAADEAEVLTDRTGAAFCVAGLRATVLAIHLWSLACPCAHPLELA